MATKKVKTPAEVLWYKEIQKTGEFGVISDSAGESILQKFDREKRHWFNVKDADIKNRIWSFLKMQSGYATNINLKNCCSVTTVEVFSSGAKLNKSKDVIISTVNHILKIEQDGRVRVYAKDDLQFGGKEYYTNVFIDIDLSSRIKNASFYQPKKNAEIEQANTYFSKLLMSGFPKIENRRCFQEFFGDTLNPKLRKAFPILIGPANGGKSQHLEYIMNLQTNSFGGNLSQLEGFDLESYIGKSLICYDELDKTINDQMFKRLIGGATLNIKRKFLSSISIKPDFKMFACANALPKFSDKSGAIDVRVYPIWVEGNNGEKIDEIGSLAIKHDLNDILDFAINGAISVILRGRILNHDEMPDDSKRISNELKRDINPTMVWVEEVGFEHTEGAEYVSKDEIYEKFRDWAESEGHNYLKNISKPNFFRDNFYPALNKIMKYDQADEKKMTFNFGMESKRLMCCPLRMLNEINVKQKITIKSDIFDVVTNINTHKKQVNTVKNTVNFFEVDNTEMAKKDAEEFEQELNKILDKGV